MIFSVGQLSRGMILGLLFQGMALASEINTVGTDRPSTVENSRATTFEIEPQPMAQPSLDPTMYPISLLLLDPPFYTYNTHCCCPENIAGIYLTQREISPLGCGMADPLGGTGGPLSLSIFDGLGLPSKEILFDVRAVPELATTPQVPLFTALPVDQQAYSDFYGNRNVFNTAVRLKAANGSTRYFSLVRVRQVMSVNGVQQTIEYLMLTRARSTASFEQQVGGGGGPGGVEVVLPRNQILSDTDAISGIADWDSGMATIVEVKLPPRIGGAMKAVKVVMLNLDDARN